MKNYYFTFGTAVHFPFYKGYLIVKANTLKEAIEKFRAKYPDIHQGTVNCAFWYDQEQWNISSSKYDMGTCHEIME